METIKKITTESDLDRQSLAFHCPGCKCLHSVCVKQGKVPYGDTWTWNGDMEKPTIRASVLVRWPDGERQNVCHSFVTDGKIEFLSDCTHELAGQTVPLPVWD